MLKEKAAKKNIYIMFVLLFLMAVAMMLVGRYKITLGDIAAIFMNTESIDTSTVTHVLFGIRFPRIAAAILVGSALAVSGATYQGIFKNPMVSPSLLGVSAGAGFGASLAIVLKLTGALGQLFAFLGGIGAVAIVYFASSFMARGNNKTLTIVLVGVVVGSLFTSLVSLIKYVGDPQDDLPAITFWLMGSLSNVMLRDLIITIIPVSIGITGLLIIKWRINIMALSDEEALSLGLSVKNIRLISIACSTLITASVVSISGIIGWVGLVIPHIARMLVGNNYKYVIPASVACGAIYMLLIDMLSRSLFSVEIPLGILTAVIGTPMFLYIMYKKKKYI